MIRAIMLRAACAAVLVTALPSCKQGKGDRCQVTADCSGGLICSTSTGTCVGNEQMGIDATVPPMDGGPKDAPAPDAPRDAPRD